jgi:hypothetical protein
MKCAGETCSEQTAGARGAITLVTATIETPRSIQSWGGQRLERVRAAQLPL